ncbi:MAG: hypothetical protein KDB26_13320 [Microthrixaceae bacterium]|nr:hypothetical protein [Microthrixaceae bacterium]
MRLTPRPGDLDEQRLVDAAAIGRRRSADQLAEWFGGFRFEDLDFSADGNRASLLSVAHHLLEGLNAEEVVDRDIINSDLPFPRLKVSGREGKSLDPSVDNIVRPANHETDIVQVRSFRIIDVLTEGATLVVNHLGPRGGRSIAELINHLSRVTATSVQVNVYMSEREAVGFGRHWDDHDVLIVQCKGKKYWEIFTPGELSPIIDYVSRDSCGESVWSGVLDPGSALYIPRGWAHEVRGFVGELSIHYTLGIRRFTGFDLLSWLTSHDNWDDLSSWISTEEGPDVLESVHLDEAAIEYGLAMWRGAMPAVAWVGPVALDRALAEDLIGWQIVPALVGGAVLGSPKDDEHLVLYASGNPFSFRRDAVPIVARLLEGDPTTVDELHDLAPKRSRASIIDLVRGLGSWDLVQVVTS